MKCPFCDKDFATEPQATQWLAGHDAYLLSAIACEWAAQGNVNEYTAELRRLAASKRKEQV
jgi:hypothetical protein